jgi:hypothetical protein
MAMLKALACAECSSSLQVKLSSEDLKMMVDQASKNSSKGVGTVDLKTFIGIMENSAW